MLDFEVAAASVPLPSDDDDDLEQPPPPPVRCPAPYSYVAPRSAPRQVSVPAPVQARAPVVVAPRAPAPYSYTPTNGAARMSLQESDPEHGSAAVGEKKKPERRRKVKEKEKKPPEGGQSSVPAAQAGRSAAQTAAPVGLSVTQPVGQPVAQPAPQPVVQPVPQPQAPTPATSSAAAAPAPAAAPVPVAAAANPVSAEVPAPAPAPAPVRAPFDFDASFLDCLLGPKQQQRALSQKEAANRKLKEATKHWSKRWELYLKENPEIIGCCREDMKAAFDAMQQSEMMADRMCRTPKAHFGAVMYFMRQLGKLPKMKGDKEEPSRKAMTTAAVKHWGERWEEHVKEFPDLIGAERLVMKKAFEEMQAREYPTCKIHKAHFSLVMNVLRLGGREDIGTWKEYSLAHLEEESREDEGPPRYERRPGDVDDYFPVPAALLDSMSQRSAADFEKDVEHLWTLTGLSIAEIQWEEHQLYLVGSSAAVERAKCEVDKVLKFYFPSQYEGRPEFQPKPIVQPEVTKETVVKTVLRLAYGTTIGWRPPVVVPPRAGMGGGPGPGRSAGGAPGVCDASRTATAPPGMEAGQWMESLKCGLTDADRKRTLAKTQMAREKQRLAVTRWADRWEEYARSHPEVIGADRAVMKAALDKLQAAEGGDKAHFSLVMNFLRQSGRRTIGAWKDYTPKGWIAPC